MSDLFFRHRRLLVLFLGLIIVGGLGSLQTLRRQEDPALSRRYADVTTFYPGATADRVESLVTEKIERRLQEIHEIETIESISRTGLSSVRVELEEQYDESDVDEIWSRVRDKLADVEPELPEQAAPPEFQDRTSTAVTLLVGFTWEGEGEAPVTLLTRLAEELESRLRVLPGTKETELYGEAEEELRVALDPLVLAEIGVDANDVAAAIGRADTRRPAGRLEAASSTIPFEVAGQLTDVDRVRAIPLRSAEDGRMLRIGDLGTVSKTQVDPPATMAILDGRRGVAVSATMLARSGRVDLWAARARGVIERYGEEVPAGVGYSILFDQSGYTEARLADLVTNLALGATIVVAVLFFMMGFRSALVVASILPLTLLLVLIELKWLEIPLHQISVTGLIIALGLLIDNAIVVVDEYTLKLRRGVPRAEAVGQVVRAMVVPLGASSLTTTLAFMPIALQPGAGGEFVGTIGVGVSLAVLSSFALSMTVIIAFAGFFIGHDADAPEGKGHGYSNPVLRERYRESIVAVLRRPALGVAIGLALPILGFAVAGSLPLQFFPANDRDQFQVLVDLPAHYSIDATRQVVDRVRAIVDANEGVVGSHWFTGESPARVFYNMFGNYDIASYGGGFVQTKSPSETERILPALQAELRRAVPEALVLALPFEQGPPFDAPIEVRLVGPDLDALRDGGERIRAVLAETEGVTYTRAKLLGGRPKLVVNASEDRARLAGLPLGEIADQLNAALTGVRAGRILDGTQDIPIRVRVEDRDRSAIDRIQATRLLRGDGDLGSAGTLAGIPLSVVGGLELTPELAAITRRNGERMNTVQAFLVPYQLIQTSLDDFSARMEAAAIELPPGVRLELGGDFEQRAESTQELAAFALPLFVLMAATIVLTFNSFRMASIIFAVAFLSVGLAMLAIWLFGHPMGFVAIVGTMGLVGLAINDAIVVLNHLRSDPRSAEADPEATAEVVLDATRHILATTMTTIGGFLPLILFGGRFWPPMATAIAGGVIGASILALYFVPSVFVFFQARQHRAQPVGVAALARSVVAKLPNSARAA
ncbi:MAG: efflux RND transporter permease subunit [Myxococcota bacterium]